MTTKKATAKKTATQKDMAAGRLTTAQFPIVGIGASAGGLEAFEAFFKEMPEKSGMGFVLIAHLDPSHFSILPELIQKKTKMKVQQVKDDMKVRPNQVYIIPPNKEMAILNGTLQLLEFSQPRGANLPIDTFFRSLAQDQGTNAVCIILSGTGTDGTLGLRAVKGEAGMAMVQDVESAKYDGMPRSAVATGLADYVLAPGEMPKQLTRYVSHVSRKQAETIAGADDTILNALQKIFILLRARTEHDFSQYKKNTICRRIERRMHVHQIDKIKDYVRYLQDSEREVSILFKELLIGVTNFFRDPAAFDQLKKKFLPDLLQDKPDDYAIRVWVPGCSSGEEAFSIAIILQEYMDKVDRHFKVQIFGTDIDEGAVNIARTGTYPESISADVSPARLKKFFTREESQYQIKKSIREMVVFAPQNIIKDPPFTKLDLLSCRNLLIYFNQVLQKKLLPIFHYSLKQDSLLFLGSSETIGQHIDLFNIQDKKWKIFTRKPSEMATHTVLDFPSAQPAVHLPEREPPKAIKKVKEIDTLQLLKTILSQSELPTCVIIDDQADIIYVHGRAGKYLEPAEGETSINILEMARPGLKAGLTSAIRRVATDRQEIVIKDLQIKNNGGYTTVSLAIRPIPDFQTGIRGLIMVVFDEEESAGGKKSAAQKLPKRKKKSEDIRKLEDELQYTKENLQTTIEELETSNEELKSTNEELQSTNEELQSTNEELETSKEELQSLNEESATVNAELQSRIDELSLTNDDMKNLLDATEIATIFLDIDQCVRRFTPKVIELVPLTNTDMGRPINHFATTLKNVNLKQYALEVLNDLVIRELDVSDNHGEIYRMRVRPYRTVNNVIDGVVITFEDITYLKKTKVFIEGMDPIIIEDLNGFIIDVNDEAIREYGWKREKLIGQSIKKVVPPECHQQADELFELCKQGQAVRNVESLYLKKTGQIFPVLITLSLLTDYSGNKDAVAIISKDISGLKAAKKK